MHSHEGHTAVNSARLQLAVAAVPLPSLRVPRTRFTNGIRCAKPASCASDVATRRPAQSTSQCLSPHRHYRRLLTPWPRSNHRLPCRFPNIPIDISSTWFARGAAKISDRTDGCSRSSNESHVRRAGIRRDDPMKQCIIAVQQREQMFHV